MRARDLGLTDASFSVFFFAGVTWEEHTCQFGCIQHISTPSDRVEENTSTGE